MKPELLKNWTLLGKQEYNYENRSLTSNPIRIPKAEFLFEIKKKKEKPVSVFDSKTGFPVFIGSAEEPVFVGLTESKNRFFGLTVFGFPSLHGTRNEIFLSA